jgi:hypothetical protein
MKFGSVGASSTSMTTLRGDEVVDAPEALSPRVRELRLPGGDHAEQV